MLGGIDDKAGGDRSQWRPAADRFPLFGLRGDPGRLLHAATKDTVAKNPDLVKRFVAATIKAYKETEANPQAAVDSMADIVGGDMADDKGKAQALAVLKVTLSVLHSKGNTGKVLGMHVAQDWDDMLNLLKQYSGLKTDQSASAFYSNDFLPQ
jgi:NitT/TauT family transport system substrate-binding protein